MTSVGATAMMVLGQTALRLLYGGEYANAASQLRILIIEAVLSGSLSIMSQPFMALGKPGVVTTLQITGLLTSIPFIIVLAPRFGTEGACVALVLSACVRVVLLGVCYAKILPGVVDWRADVRTEFGNVFRSARGRVALRFRPAEA
jgi:O-antigen/teichoic acid export membrane protein